jgi:chromosome segregation ATPase
MSQLQFLAEDVTPAKAVSTRGKSVRLTSPLRHESALPALELSPDVDSVHSSTLTAVPAAASVDCANMMDSLAGELYAAQTRNDELMLRIGELESQQQRLIAHHAILNTTINELHQELQEERVKSTAAAKQIDVAERQYLQAIAKQSAETTEENDTLATAVRQMQDRWEAESRLRFSAEEECSRLHHTVDELRAAVTRMESQQRTDRDAEAQRRNVLEAELNAVTSAMSDLQVRLTTSEAARRAAEAAHGAEKTATQRQTDELRKRMSVAKALQRNKAELEAALADAHGEIDKKYHQLQAIATEIGGFALALRRRGNVPDSKKCIEGQNPLAQLKATYECFDAVMAVYEKSTNDVASLRHELSSMATTKIQLEAECAASFREAEALRAELAGAKLQCSVFEQSLAENRIQHEAAVTTLECSLGSCARRAEASEFRCLELETVTAELRREVVAAGSQADEIKSLSARLRAMTDALSSAEETVRAAKESAVVAARRERHATAKLKIADASMEQWRKEMASVCAREKSEAPAGSLDEVRRFVSRHSPTNSANPHITDALNSISADIFTQSRQLHETARELAAEKDRVKFLEAELIVYRDAPKHSPSPLGRRTLPAQLLAYDSPPLCKQH